MQGDRAMLATSHKLLANPQAAEIITILAVSPHDDDHVTLLTIFSHRNWRIERARAYGEARRKLRDSKAAVVICERDLPDGTWKDVLYELARMDNAPPLIVMSRSADDQVWAEVLNLGGYDVLQKPLEPSEVRRAVAMAWRQSKGASSPVGMPLPPEQPFEPHALPLTYSAN